MCSGVCVSAYLSLAEAQAGVDVLAVDPLQEAAAAVQHRLLLPRLEVAEQLIVHLHVSSWRQRPSEDVQPGRPPAPPYLSTLPNDGLRGRRVGLRPQDGRRRALVSAVTLPERGLHPPSSPDRGQLPDRGGGGGQHQCLQGLDLCLEDIDLQREPSSCNHSNTSNNKLKSAGENRLSTAGRFQPVTAQTSCLNLPKREHFLLLV